MAGNNGEATVENTSSAVGDFYDQLSVGWEGDFGEHLHIGFYDVPAPPENLRDQKAAAVRMVEEAIKFAAISDEESKWPRRVVDVGCGLGGSSRYLAKKYGAHVEGITLSTWQAERATTLTAAEGLSDKVAFQVADALDQPFPDGHFDLVWAMESAEHMADKEKFMQELVRVSAPGGLIIITTCCHRDLLKGETSLQPREQELLDNISRICCFPAWCSTADYVRMAQDLSLQNIKTADWSKNTAPFWESKAEKYSAVLEESAMKAFKGVNPLQLWVDGFKQDLVKYAVITAQKPA